MTSARLALVASLAGLSLFGSTALQAQLNYASSEIALGEWPDDVLREDMDGDGRHDLIVPQWSADAGRELLIYLQDASGRYPPEPSRHVEIKPEIIAIAMADLRPEPGKELLLFSGSGVFSLSSAIPSYTDNLKPLFDWELIASVPDRRRVLYFPPPQDMDGDGHVDLLLPGRDGYGYFRGSANEQFSLVHAFSTVNEELDPSEVPLGGARLDTSIAINEREGIVLNVRALGTTAFEDFLTTWQQSEQTNLLEARHWLPAALYADMNGDNAQDIVFMNIGNDLYGQVNILAQNAEGGFANMPDWRGPIDTRGDIRLLDVNGDGMLDLLRILDNSSEWDVQFFLNKGGEFALGQPDQVMRFSGYDLTLSVTDIAGDGRPQLSITYYTIPVIGAVRNASIVRSQLLYARSTAPGEIFTTRPNFKLDESFSAAAVRGLSSQIHLQTDLDGDGRKDAIALSPEGAIAARAISSSLQFSDIAFWQHVPTRSVLRFDVQDLNSDGVADLLLYHSTAMTLLVSTP